MSKDVYMRHSEKFQEKLIRRVRCKLLLTPVKFSVFFRVPFLFNFFETMKGIDHDQKEKNSGTPHYCHAA
jgi:hypothetical protein